jgi:hypothetical protein
MNANMGIYKPDWEEARQRMADGWQKEKKRIGPSPGHGAVEALQRFPIYQ